MTATIQDPEAEDIPLERGEEEGEGQDEAFAATAEPVDVDIRTGVALAFPTVAAAVMVGAAFAGIAGRFYAGIAGLLGVALAVACARIRRPALTNLAIFGGLFGIGLVMVLPSGASHVLQIQSFVQSARAAGNVLRPPVPLTPGWQAILGWVMGLAGFGAAWLAIEFKRPMTGLVVPLPLAGIAAISVPKPQQVASGLAVLVLYAIGLGVLSSARALGERAERPPVSYQIRKVGRALPVIAVITAALYGLAQTNILFPKPRIDPTNQPQKPKTVPLSAVPDRVLFEVKADFTGPWRIGGLDVYDGTDWRLPPFSQSQLKDVPRSGIVDPNLQPGARATFTIRGLTGAVLPGLPNPVGIIASGPKLAYDSRGGNIRTIEGEVKDGLEYTVVAAAPATVDRVRHAVGDIPPALAKFVDIPAAPPAVSDLIGKAPKTSKWDEFDYLRTWVLDNVTATGTGQPASIPPSRVQEILTTKEASPFEIVATEALLARWAGLPSRIGYGFDGGDPVDDTIQVRPRHGALFVEVWFPGFEWLPVVGTPKKAKATLGNTSEQKTDPNVAPSEDIGVRIYLPEIVPPGSTFAKQVRAVLQVVVPVAAGVLLTYIQFPLVTKARRRNRRRRAALRAGRRARVALAYVEFRDHATDFGYRYPADTPLWFLGRFVTDEEHTEFAWLVTRCLWGDLHDDVSEDDAGAAEELSRTLRRRLAAAQPATLRIVARYSRLSIRYPYVVEPARHAPTPTELEMLGELRDLKELVDARG